MRLINTSTLKLTSFIGSDVPKYGILSHTWVPGEEVTLQEFESGTCKDKSGYAKIKNFCVRCQRAEIAWAWVDTCCIDKTNGVELSEAINSMFSWYRKASVCFAYLRDVPRSVPSSGTAPIDPIQCDVGFSVFKSSSWFRRGWTLQELLAPAAVIFFNESWVKIGNRMSLQAYITEATGITAEYLMHEKSLGLASVAERMFWASKRETTREEDLAYCLLGLFGVNMPLIYGEGGIRAFVRLQEEIITRSADHSIFAWFVPEIGNTQHFTDGRTVANEWKSSGLLAPSPRYFEHSGNVRRHLLQDPIHSRFLARVGRKPYQMTNRGLQIELGFDSQFHGNCRVGVLNCYFKGHPDSSIGIYIQPQESCHYWDHTMWQISEGDVERTHLKRQATISHGSMISVETVFVRRGF